MNETLQQLNQATSILTWIKTIYSTQMNHRIQWLNQAPSISVWIKTVHPAQMNKRLQQLSQATSIKTIYPDSLITTVLSHPWLIWGWWLTCAVCCQLVLLFSQMAQPSDSTITVIHHYRLKLSESQMVYPLTVWYCSLLSGDLQTALLWQKLPIVWYCSLLSGDLQTALFWQKLPIVWCCLLLSGDLQTALFWQKLPIVWYCSLLFGDLQTALFWQKLPAV